MSTHSERIRAGLSRSEDARHADESPSIEPVAVHTENLEALLGSEAPSVRRPAAPVETALPLLATNMDLARREERSQTRRLPLTALTVGLALALGGISAFLMRDRRAPAPNQIGPAPAANFTARAEAEPRVHGAPAAAAIPVSVPVPAPAPPPVVRQPAVSQPAPKAPETPPASRTAVRSFILPPPNRRTTEAVRALLPDAPPVAPSEPIPSAVAGLPPTLNRIPPPPDAPALLSAPAPPASAPTRQIKVGGSIQAANLIKKVTPVYPAIARETRVQGTVRFTATIGKNGTIQNLQLLSGPALLVSPAAEAVKQWVYRPTRLNGEPVEVVTQIDVAFTLGQ